MRASRSSRASTNYLRSNPARRGKFGVSGGVQTETHPRAKPRNFLKEWRRARDSNPQGPRGPVDFKFEPPLASPCRDRSSSLLIMSLRDALAGLKARCRPMTHDGDSQEMAKQRGRPNLDRERFPLGYLVKMPRTVIAGGVLFCDWCL